MIYKQSIILLPIIYIYGGIAMFFLGKYFNVAPYFDALFEGTGILLLMLGVGALFYRRIIKKIENLTNVSKNSNMTGVVDIHTLATDSFRSISHKILPSTRVNIIVDCTKTSKDVITFFEFLRHSGKNTDIRLLVTGILTESLPNFKAKIDDSYSHRLANDLLESFYARKDQSTQIRVCSQPVFQTIVMSDSYGIIFIPYDPFEGESLTITVDQRSPILRHYKKIFGEIWEQSENYNPKRG